MRFIEQKSCWKSKETLREKSGMSPGTPCFYQLVENFSNDRSDEGLTDLVMRLYLFAVACPIQPVDLQDLAKITQAQQI